MNEIRSEIVINASKEVIWDILTDFAAYPEWNPFIVRVIGTPKLGEKVFFVARVKGALIPVLATILQFKNNEKLSWGGPSLNGLDRLFGAEHYFGIEEIKKGRCRFVNNEQMRGVIPNALWPFIARSRPAYVAMNDALKARAEAVG